MRVWLGKTFAAIGAVHCVFGLVMFGDLLAPALRAGLFNTITPSTPPERNMAYWFVLLGVMTVLFGVLLDRVERERIEVPALLPWGLLVLASVGCVMSPVSGFWLLWIPTVGLFLRRRSLEAGSAPADAD